MNCFMQQSQPNVQLKHCWIQSVKKIVFRQNMAGKKTKKEDNENNWAVSLLFL